MSGFVLANELECDSASVYGGVLFHYIFFLYDSHKPKLYSYLSRRASKYRIRLADKPTSSLLT